MANRLADFFERLADADTQDALGSAVTSLRDAYDTDHIAYHCVRSGGAQWGATTYADDWVDAYVENGFHTVDPVVLTCFRRITPVDWKALDWSPRSARALLAEAVGHGIGNQGCSLPVRGPDGQFALFTVNGTANDETWARFGDDRMDELILAAHYINERAISLEVEAGADGPMRTLSPRETDALSLLACGRSRAQAAERLAISEHTLRVYIEGARRKLGAANTTHAVAAALSRGLISL